MTFKCLQAVVAHHNAVGNKTVLVCRKQSFTFVFRVKFHISKLPWDIPFLIKSRKYVFLFQLLKWQDCSYLEGSRKEMEMRTVAERKPPPPTSIMSPDPNHVMFSAEPDPATCTKAGWDNGIPHRTDRDQKELSSELPARCEQEGLACNFFRHP